ncbi:reprolysin-like metallopeptidase [Capnocytophaga canimorsus]|uniref:reprolysin-like metallopeptidase n=1 Tax=Capnocytophaga canimorsus TaxID=28188 RepID=UPI00385B4FDE
MKYYIYLIFSFISFGQVVFAQETIKTSTKAIDVIHLFSVGNKVEWAVPISKNEKILLQWEERHTSFTQSEGIRSFVGYHDKSLVAVISILNSTISGNIRWKEKEIVLKTSEDGFLMLYTEGSHHKCGTCTNGHCHTNEPSTKRPVLLSDSDTSTPSIPNTNVLRVYRLAMPISYEYFSDVYVGFSSKVEEVKTFWATREMELNEVYVRDLGIRFEVVKDEKLISKQEDEISKKSASYIINNATRIINSKIGEKNYDLGIYIAKVTEVAGLAYLENAYKTEKAAAVSLVSRSVIMHEIGHLFGARHTFSITSPSRPQIDPASDKTEMSTGQSIMSYGYPRDFFSLRSIQMIREKLVNVPYFSDTNRTQKVGDNLSVANFPYGKYIQNQPPTINKTKIKTSYKIPKETFFQFYIPAQDPENKPLLYAAHQTDIRRGTERSIASFLTRKATTNNPVAFQTEYSERTRNEMANTKPNAVGTFTFWLGVSDAQPQQTSDYISQYDMAQTQVIIEEGTPFKITSSMKNNYKGGEDVQLTWSVDSKIFDKNTSKVRILLSDDFGKTFKYTLVASTENDGNHVVKLPNISVNSIAFGEQKWNVVAGIIKIEEIDGIAYALTTFDPKQGGFTITRDPSQPEILVFTKTPKALLSVTCDAIPDADNSQFATDGCASVHITHQDTKIGGNCNYTIERVYTATGCNQSLIFTQTISVRDDKAPTFNEPLPTNVSVEENNIPTQVDLTATDNCSENIQVTKSQEIKEENGNRIIIYKWEASDECGNEATHIQKITVIPSEINFVGELPENLTITCEKEIPSVPTLEVSGNCNPKVVYNGQTKSNEKCKNDYVLTRSWIATNDCGKSITHTQIITIKDDVKPTFSGILPTDISVEENNIPTQIELTATDNCSEKAQVTNSREERQENGNKVIIYKWEASDECGNKTTHTQKVTVKKSLQPTPPNGGSEVEKEMIVYNGVSTESGSENYLKFEPIEDYKNLQIEIFNELGQKVYESKNYQKNGEVFRGYANVKGVFRKGKRLPTGTYFYVLKYQDITGKSNTKQGYVFVR